VSVEPPPARVPLGTQSELATAEREVLIVVSKMKKYIKDRSGMNCSDAVADAISDHVRAACDDAIRAAAQDGRKTVLDRDVQKPVRR
jgi:histone H3/H4